MNLINVLQCLENPFLSRFWPRFPAFCLKQLVLVEEFLIGEDKLEHGTEFFNHSKNSCKEGHIKTTGRFSFAFGSRGGSRIFLRRGCTTKEWRH